MFTNVPIYISHRDIFTLAIVLSYSTVSFKMILKFVDDNLRTSKKFNYNVIARSNIDVEIFEFV